MLRAVYLSILLVSLAGATGPALAQSFSPPHPIPPVDIGEVNIPSYGTPPTYGAPSQHGRASAAGPDSYPPAAVDRVPSRPALHRQSMASRCLPRRSRPMVPLPRDRSRI